MTKKGVISFLFVANHYLILLALPESLLWREGQGRQEIREKAQKRKTC